MINLSAKKKAINVNIEAFLRKDNNLKFLADEFSLKSISIKIAEDKTNRLNVRGLRLSFSEKTTGNIKKKLAYWKFQLEFLDISIYREYLSIKILNLLKKVVILKVEALFMLWI